MSQVCVNCGREIATGYSFCPSCGAAVVSAAPSTTGDGVAGGPAAGAPRPTGLPGWVIALIVVAVTIAVAGPLLAGAAGLWLFAHAAEEVVPAIQDEMSAADERAVRDGVASIQAGVEAWAADHHGRYPAAPRVVSGGLVADDGSGYVDPWPRNPYLGGPMQPGRGAGRYIYVRGSGGRSYTLTGFATGGVPVIRLP